MTLVMTIGCNDQLMLVAAPHYAFCRACQARQRAAGWAILNSLQVANMACFGDKEIGDVSKAVIQS